MSVSGTFSAAPVLLFTVMRRATCLSVCGRRSQKARPKQSKAIVSATARIAMEPCITRKILFLFLAICFVFSVILAETIVPGCHDLSHNHEGTGENCPICLVIQKANNILKQASALLFFVGCLALLERIPKSNTGLTAYPLSPVALKVRFNS